MRRLFLIGAALAALLFASPAGAVGPHIEVPGPLLQHSVLRSSEPASGAQLDRVPDVVKLTFNENIKNFEPVLAVLGPDGKHLESGPATVDGELLSTTMADGGSGVYTVAFRVVSADGHPVNGQYSFSVGAAGAAASPAESSPGIPVWLWVSGAGVLVLALGGVIVMKRRTTA